MCLCIDKRVSGQLQLQNYHTKSELHDVEVIIRSLLMLLKVVTVSLGTQYEQQEAYQLCLQLKTHPYR